MLDQKTNRQGRDVPVEQAPHPLRNKLFLHRGFSFEDDVWDLNFRATSAAQPSYNKLSFRAFPPSIKNDVKEFLAHDYWGAGLSNSSMQGILVILRKAIALLEQRLGEQFSPTNFTHQDAAAIEELFAYLKNEHTRRNYIACIARFAAFLRELHAGEPADFRPDPLNIPLTIKKERSYSQGIEHVIPDEVSEALMEAISQHNLVLEEKTKTSSTEKLSSDHLYLVVLALLLFSGRRVSEILLLQRNCLRELTMAEEEVMKEPGVWLKYGNVKSHLKQNEIFIPEPAAQLVREQVARVLEWTEELFQQSKLDKLFLTNWLKGKKNIRIPNRSAFATWLSGVILENGDIYRSGFIHRYNIKYQGEYYYINPHQTRHTLAYKAYLGGASYVEVGDHLGHARTKEGFSSITGVYIHGHEKDVQLIRKMHDRRLVTGKALPVLNNRSAVVQHLDASDVAIWRAQGMMVHATHYGHCILPEVSGPCVCGDPCYIGPQGDGCDYALYTPESKKNLLEDRAILLQQIEELERNNPKHPQLGQWKARLERLDTVLGEINDAEERADQNLPADRPRANLVPQDPQFEPQQAQIPAKPLPRRNASPQRANEVDHQPEPRQELDATIIAHAHSILQEREQMKVPITIGSLARQLGIKAHLLYTCPPICDRLAKHNKQCPVSREAIFETKLKELQILNKTATEEEFAELCGISRSTLSKKFPEWQEKLATHNYSVHNESLCNLAEQHLYELIATDTCEPLLIFTKHIGSNPASFKKHCPDIAWRVLEHNRELDLRNSINSASREVYIAHINKRWNEVTESGKYMSLTEFAKYCSVDPYTVRVLCPELLPKLRKAGEWVKMEIDAALAQAFAEIEKSSKVHSVNELAKAAGITTNTLYANDYYHHWLVRLHEYNKAINEHNKSLTEAQLQAVWVRMQRSGTLWSINKFAKEANIERQALQKNHPDWYNRLKEETARHNDEVMKRLEQVLERAHQSRTFLTVAEACKAGCIGHKELKKKYASIYVRMVEHNETTFRPIVDDVWSEVVASGEYPTPNEFAQRCGIPYLAAFELYFPDVIAQLQTHRKNKVYDGKAQNC